MYKRILAPLDGSAFSECSLEHVRAIATGCHVPEVILLMVVEPIPHQVLEDWSPPENWHRDAQKHAGDHAKDYLSKVADSLKKDVAATQAVVIQGRPADTILKFADKNRVDLIIMSTHGRSGPSRWVFGSVADKIIRHSIVPVLITSPSGCRVG